MSKIKANIQSNGKRREKKYDSLEMPLAEIKVNDGNGEIYGIEVEKTADCNKDSAKNGRATEKKCDCQVDRSACKGNATQSSACDHGEWIEPEGHAEDARKVGGIW